MGISSTFSNRPERSISNATTVPSSKPNVVAENARSENPFSISSIAIISQPKPNPMTMPSSPLWLAVDELRSHLADGIAADGAQGSETEFG